MKKLSHEKTRSSSKPHTKTTHSCPRVWSWKLSDSKTLTRTSGESTDLEKEGTSQATIFTHWKEIDQIPNEYKLLNDGLDFGYTNDPTAVVRIYTDGHGFAVDEICYATRLTNSDIAKMLRDNGVHRSDVVICDSAEPKSIDEIHAHGFNTHGARKGRDSIRSGISFLHSRPLAVTSRSVNLIRELRNYKWKEDKNGKQLNEPVDSFNHAIDAMRYGITWNQTNPNFGSYAIG
jgi:phage terminase large subunit